MSRGDSECSLERRSWIERDTATGRDIGAGKRENKGERRDAHRVFVSATCADGPHSLLVTSARGLSRETRKIEERRKEEREGERKGKKERCARKTEVEDKPRPKRILEVKIERVSGELLLFSDSRHSRLRHRRVRSSPLKIARKVAA